MANLQAKMNSVNFGKGLDGDKEVPDSLAIAVELESWAKSLLKRKSDQNFEKSFFQPLMHW